VTDAGFERHLDSNEIAAYVDGSIDGEERFSIQAHLAACAECRAEVAEVSRIVRTAPAARRLPSRIWIPTAAAAVFALLWLGPRAGRERAEPELREEAVTMTVPPRPITPAGTVDTVRALVWSSVPYANSYRVRLFDADGTVLWEREAADTVVPIPDSIALRAELLYYWRVEAYTGFDRRAASDLVEFRLRRGGQ
jgi:anti-sigma factor RsiW